MHSGTFDFILRFDTTNFFNRYAFSFAAGHTARKIVTNLSVSNMSQTHLRFNDLNIGRLVGLELQTLSVWLLCKVFEAAVVSNASRKFECLLNGQSWEMVVNLLHVGCKAAQAPIIDLAIVVSEIASADQTGVVLSGDELEEGTFAALRRADDDAERSRCERGRNIA